MLGVNIEKKTPRSTDSSPLPSPIESHSAGRYSRLQWFLASRIRYPSILPSLWDRQALLWPSDFSVRTRHFQGFRPFGEYLFMVRPAELPLIRLGGSISKLPARKAFHGTATVSDDISDDPIVCLFSELPGDETRGLHKRGTNHV
jgi:hypothetical protein